MRILIFLCLLFAGIINPVQAQVERIISLAPHATELAFAAGLGDKLVAVSEYSDYPPQAKKLEKVANYQGINLERILKLQPDLVIVWPSGNPAKEIAKLKQLGLTIYSTETKTLEDIATNIEQLSQYADNPQIGKNITKLIVEKRKKLLRNVLYYDMQLNFQGFASSADPKDKH